MDDQRITRLEAEKDRIRERQDRIREQRDALAREFNANPSPSEQRLSDIGRTIDQLNKEINDSNDQIKALNAQILALMSLSSRAALNAEDIKRIVAEVVSETAQTLHKPESISLSNVNTTQLNEILEYCKVTDLVYPDDEEETRIRFRQFEWADGIHDYLSFVSPLFRLQRHMQLIVCPRGFNRTSITPIPINGQADLAITQRVSDAQAPAATFVVFQFTKPKNVLSAQCLNQVKLIHLTADLNSSRHVITVFTDLQQHWQIFWFEPGEQGKTLLACRKYLPSKAIDLIRRFVAYSYSRIPGLNVPAVQVPPEVQRICKVRNMWFNAQAADDDDDDVAKIDESFFNSEKEYEEWQMQQKIINILRYSQAFAEPFHQLSQDFSGLESLH